MTKYSTLSFSKSSLLITAFSLWAVFCLFNLYYLFKYFGFVEYVNHIDLSNVVAWQHRFFYPKNDFKIFYLFSVIAIPSFAILTTYLCSSRIPQILQFFKRTILATSFFLIITHVLGFHSPPQLLFINLITVSIFLFTRNSSLNYGFHLSLYINYAYQKIFTLFRPYQLRINILKQFVVIHHIKIVIGLLFVILWNFSYKHDTGIWYNYYHHNFLIATINDLLHGKTILVDTFNQYGVLLPLSFSGIFRYFLSFSYMNLYLLFMIFTMIYYLALYYFVLKLTNNKIYSIWGVFLIAGINFLFNHQVFPSSENYVWPGGTILRYFFDVFLFLSLLSNENLNSYKKYWLSCVITIYALFHNFEFGISLLFSFILLLSYPILLNHSRYSWGPILRRLIKFIIPLIITGLIAIGLFYLYTFSSAHQPPNWDLFSKFSMLYQSGLTNAKTPNIGWYLIPAILYFGVLTNVLYLSLKRATIGWKWQVLSAYSFYGLLTLNYYFGRSYYSNLWVVIIPAIVIFLVILLDLSRSRNYRIIYVYSVIFAICLSVISSYLLIKKLDYRIKMAEELYSLPKYENNRGFVVSYSAPLGYEAEELLKSVSTIKELVPPSEKVLLISRYDAVILVMADRTNYLPFPLLEQIYFQEDLELVKQLLSDNTSLPKYLFIDKFNPHETLSNLPMPRDILNEIIQEAITHYQYIDRSGILEIYQLVPN